MKSRLLAFVVVAAACNDPVHADRVDALGPEADGVSPGPTHRPGQPCLTCHGGQGPSSSLFAIAGTVYQTPDPASPPQEGVAVSIFDGTVDLDGGPPASATAKTNAAGNFFVPSSGYSPSYPLHVSLDFPGLAGPTTMTTHMGRDGSCATCHFDPAGTASPGHVYLVADPADLPDAEAP